MAAKITGRPAESDNALDLFDTIKSQGGFVYGDTIKRRSGVDAATVRGSIGRGDAQVELPFPIPLRTFGPVSQRAMADYAETQAVLQAMTALHEIMHLAGLGYGDYTLSNALAAMRGVVAPRFGALMRHG